MVSVDRADQCVLLAHRYWVVAEGVRDLLKTQFTSVFLVDDMDSLHEGAARLHPTVILIDLSFAEEGPDTLLSSVREVSPSSKLIALATHEQVEIARQAISTADAVVLKRDTARDLLDAVDAVIRGAKFLPADFGEFSRDVGD
jgi:DNA-binding NarL/FixJ family response regulator